MIALITAALQGLASLRDLFNMIKDLNLKQRLETLEARQMKMNAGYLKLASAQTPEEMKNALSDIASSWNS